MALKKSLQIKEFANEYHRIEEVRWTKGSPAWVTVRSYKNEAASSNEENAMLTREFPFPVSDASNGNLVEYAYKLLKLHEDFLGAIDA